MAPVSNISPTTKLDCPPTAAVTPRAAPLLPPGLEPAEAISRVLGGDSEAFRSLVEAYEKPVFGLCRRLLYGNDTEAEDLTQETFMRAYEHLGRLEDRRRFAPWLFQIARSLCRDRRRRLMIESRAIEVRLEELQRAERLAERDESDVESPLAAALADLPGDERHVLFLRYFSGLAYDEIGEQLELTFPQVDHLIRKARSRLSRRVQIRRQREVPVSGGEDS